MKKLFGTDGIRGVANSYPMTVEMAVNIGRATATFFEKEDDKASAIVIGRDTRISGDMLESALTAGICSMGREALSIGVFPTPGVAFMTSALNAAAGIVISASHNPFHDNGIKIFKKDGFKLTDEEEIQIEQLIFDNEWGSQCATTRDIGQIHTVNQARKQYRSFITDVLPAGFSLKGMKIVLDCSNGATYQVAPELFSELGADVCLMFVNPNGTNINNKCGSQHLDAISQTVVDEQATLGLAFDGDGDRVVAVDEKGRAVTGDQILAICGKYMKDQGKLRSNRVVSTVMSNFGFGVALKALGIEHVTADVGDRYVLRKMIETNAVLGGEDSGHLIFLDDHTTGDGIFAGLKVIEAMLAESKPLSQLTRIMTIYPQVLINVPVTRKPDLQTVSPISKAIQSVENSLKGKGRVLVRYSGTQPLCRVMVEGADTAHTEKYGEKIAEAVQKSIGK